MFTYLSIRRFLAAAPLGLCAWLLLGPALPGAAQIQNGSFESGYTGWTQIGKNQVVTGTFGDAPASGTDQSFSDNNNTDGAAAVGALETGLGLASGALTALGQGTVTYGSAITQPVTLQPGDTAVFTFHYDFLTAQDPHYPPFVNDFAFVSLSGQAPVLLANATQAAIPEPAATGRASHSIDDYLAETGYRTGTYTLSATANPGGGTYKLGFGAVSIGGGGIGSAVLVDAISASIVGRPTAVAQSVTTPENTAKTITLTGTDPNTPVRPLTYAVTANPAHGTLSGTAPNLVYTPAPGYMGPDSFTFKVNNGVSSSLPATVSLTVTGIPGSHAHLLWDKTDGTASLWTVNAGGSYASVQYGPFSGWTARVVSAAPDGTTWLLWTNTNGTASLWHVTALTASGYTATQYGPYAGYTAVSLSVGGDGSPHLLWDKTDGTALLWTVDPANGTFTYTTYGPYAGWTAKAVASGATVTDLLWAKTDGTASGYRIASDGSLTYHTFGPYSSYAAVGLSVGPDDGAHLLWDKTDGSAALWSADFTSGAFTFVNYGPYSGYSARAIATGPDNVTRMLWDNTNGTASLWSVTGSGYTYNAYGPFSGWTAVGVSAGP